MRNLLLQLRHGFTAEQLLHRLLRRNFLHRLHNGAGQVKHKVPGHLRSGGAVHKVGADNVIQQLFPFFKLAGFDAVDQLLLFLQGVEILPHIIL
ncbi:hypothetical protein D3C75_903130 [compost metagenome]